METECKHPKEVFSSVCSGEFYKIELNQSKFLQYEKSYDNLGLQSKRRNCCEQGI